MIRLANWSIGLQSKVNNLIIANCTIPTEHSEAWTLCIAIGQNIRWLGDKCDDVHVKAICRFWYNTGDKEVLNKVYGAAIYRLHTHTYMYVYGHSVIKHGLTPWLEMHKYSILSLYTHACQ